MKVFNQYLRHLSIKNIKRWVLQLVETKKNKSEKPFYVKTVSDKSVSYESVYGNIREKQRLIDMFKKQICDLKERYGDDCENAKYLYVHIEDLKRDLSELWDIFRGKVKKKVEKTIYVPMSIDQAINFLAFLMNEDPIQNDVEIRRVLGCIKNEPNVCFETNNKIALDRLKTNLEYIQEEKDKVETIKKIEQ